MLHTCCWWILKDKRYLMFSKIFCYFCFVLLITCWFRMFWHGVLCDIFITLSHIDSFSFCCLEICLCSFGICYFFCSIKKSSLPPRSPRLSHDDDDDRNFCPFQCCIVMVNLLNCHIWWVDKWLLSLTVLTDSLFLWQMGLRLVYNLDCM